MILLPFRYQPAAASALVVALPGRKVRSWKPRTKPAAPAVLMPSAARFTPLCAGVEKRQDIWLAQSNLL